MTQIIVLPKVQPATRTQKGTSLTHLGLKQAVCSGRAIKPGAVIGSCLLKLEPKDTAVSVSLHSHAELTTPLFNSHAVTQTHILLPHPILLLTNHNPDLLHANIFSFKYPPSSNLEDGIFFLTMVSVML